MSERGREGARETDRQTERDRQIERESERERERARELPKIKSSLTEIEKNIFYLYEIHIIHYTSVHQKIREKNRKHFIFTPNIDDYMSALLLP